MRSILVGAAALLAVGACGSKSSKLDTLTPPAGDTATAGSAAADDSPGIDLRLSNGTSGAPAFDRAKLAPAQPLADADLAPLFARAQPIVAPGTDKKGFALRPGTAPPPKPGNQIAAAFPPDPATLAPPSPHPVNDAHAPVHVLRVMPEGPIPLAPSLSITFDQPMVAVTSQDDAAATTPVKLTPQPKGRWRWLGTRTVMFDPDVRFPQATTYTVEVPATTKSATGAAIDKASTTTFETPPPAVETMWPQNGPTRTDTPIFLAFDQKIDPQAVLAKLRVTASGGWSADRPIALALLDAAQIAARHDDTLDALVDAAHAAEHDGRWLVALPTAPLPADTGVTVEVPAGTPSAEGPNVTTVPQIYSFRTYPPLALVDAWCSYQNKHCTPGTAFEITFNNPIDRVGFDPASITVEPAIPNVRVTPSGNALYIAGATRARTTYTVTIPARLADQFGQHLGKSETRDFTTIDADPTFYGASGLVVLDPAAKKPTLDFFTTNYDGLAVKLYKVAPEDYAAWVHYQQSYDSQKTLEPPGKKVFDATVDTHAAKNLLAEDHIDLAPALDKAGFGHAIAIVEPVPWDTTQRGQPPRMMAWVQATHLGLSLAFDRTMHVYASDLATGAPLAGVAITHGAGAAATTDATGLVALPTGARPEPIIAKKGADSAFMLPSRYGRYGYEYGDNYGEAPDGANDRRQLAWYVVDDRHLYRPGETVHLKGWLRVIDRGVGGDVDLAGSAVAPAIAYRVVDARGNELSKGKIDASPAGGFELVFPLPATPNLGNAHVEFTADATAGGAALVRSQTYSHYFSIEEFRRPEFEVHAQASQGPFLVGDGGDVTVAATYFAGGGLAGADVHWTATASRTSYAPPNRDDFTFGTWTPWWIDEGAPSRMMLDDDLMDEGLAMRRGGGGGGAKNHRRTHWELDGKTDGAGSHALHLDFLSVRPAVPMSVVASASVTDVNRQQWSASASLIVHPASYYVGLRAKRPFVEKGTPFDVDVIGVDLDGALAKSAAVAVTAVRLDQVFDPKSGAYREKEVDPQTCAVTMAAQAPAVGDKDRDGSAPCHFQTQTGGSYRVTATITDPKGRTNTSTLSYWVSGGEQIPARTVVEERVEVIPDKKTYAVGSTAELLVMSPFYPAEGVLSWRRGGIVKLERISLTGPTTIVTVPIEDAMVPNLYVKVDLVGAAQRLTDAGQVDPSLPKRPAYAAGGVDLPIPPVTRTLHVAVAPGAAKLAPGAAAAIDVAVTDAAGKPVANAETAVIVVDESILSLAAYTHPDPIGTFYPERGADAYDSESRAMVTLARPDATVAMQQGQGQNGAAMGSGSMDPAKPMPPAATAMAPAAPGASEVAVDQTETKQPIRRAQFKNIDAIESFDGDHERQGGKSKGKDTDGAPESTAAIAIRQNFDPLAAFAPSVTTDANGKATVHIAKLPDNLTRYRIVAIAVAGGKQYGKGESAVTARLPLMVRPSAPRFLNFGDTFQLPVVLQNQTDAEMTVKVGARVANARLTNGGGRVVTVPANDRVEVLFPAATEMAGTARFQFVASGGGDIADAAEVSLPVWTPATTEAFATYGVIDAGAIAQPVAMPAKVVPQFGGLEVSTSSTQLASLTDALLYIVHYPFECSEQRSSRVMSIAALRDVLTAFDAPGLPPPAALATSNAVDIAKIVQLQNPDGGFVYWERAPDRESVPYLSVYVTHALLLAKQKGYTVPEDVLARAKQFLATIEQHYPRAPYAYPIEVRRSISAYALATRRLAGDTDIAKGQALLADAGGPDKVNLETDAWLLQLFAKDARAAAERAAIVHLAMQKVAETAGAANFTTSYADGGYLLLASDRRVDALMLEALIDEQPDSDLIPKLVTGLLAHRKAGRWTSTQENTWVLLALDHYFQTFEKATPSFTARVWLGDAYAGDHGFHGHTTDNFSIAIAMADVVSHDKQSLIIQKDGAPGLAGGRLYYRVGMTYAPESLAIGAADYGFVVTRTYEGVDDPGDVTRGADGAWHVKAGARVRVKVAMVNENRRYHVALVDPMPAGFEAMNPALATSAPPPPEPASTQRYGWWNRSWYEHQNLRDDRAEAFTELLWEGVHAYAYIARATTPGVFVVPPSKAEEMYMPETFGRSASDRVVVE